MRYVMKVHIGLYFGAWYDRQIRRREERHPNLVEIDMYIWPTIRIAFG
jgi:hypothetical protein